MILWDKKYEIGVRSIDEQHQNLVRLINKVELLLQDAEQGIDIYDDLLAVVTEIKEYTVYHFRYEEKLFHQFHYEFEEEHKKEHDDLIQAVENLDLSGMDENQLEFGKGLVKFLVSWLFRHIGGSDFLYRDMLIANGVK